MSEHQSEYDGRIQKSQQLSQSGYTVYPAKNDRSHQVAEVLAKFNSLTDKPIIVCGRIRSWREHGKLTFTHLEDASGSLQLVFSADQLGKFYDHDLKLFDVGDIVQVSGKVFLTKRGEKSVLVSKLSMLSKALRPLPDKWHGLHDEELRYRERYVDMIMRPELRQLFVQKSTFWNSMRAFLVRKGFLEVETPVLEATPGGADAQPFATHHNALDIDLYLRISMGELWQKRLMVGGFEKTFEIGRQFRNEGISPEHLQDYTQMEFYWAYANYEAGMKLVEELYKTCVMEAFGTLRFMIHGFEINLDQPWPRIDYATVVQEYTGIDILTATDKELLQRGRGLNITMPEDGLNRARLIDQLWKYCRKKIAGPVFLINHPVVVSPLAKRLVSNPNLVERYQVIIAGSELGNGYTELNDPQDQRSRFEEQAALREAGDAEAQMHDEDFVRALEYGMPPTTGFGVSERLFSFLVDKPIRECVMFPLLRPKTIHQTVQIDQPDRNSSRAVPIDDSERGHDQTLQLFEPGITLADAKSWMQEHIKDQNLRNHMLATGAFMRRLATHFGAKVPTNWEIAGVLHDIDWESVSADKHSLVGADWLQQKGIHQLIVDAVREHNEKHHLEPHTLLSKSMQCLEQLTGLVLAVTLVRPDRDIMAVKVSSVKKKFKDKSFAQGVDRSNIERCAIVLHMDVDTAISLCLEAMQGVADQLRFASK